ncbi:winged helix-turn-helix transcriptional regulator [Candidatus Woesearchaeota archaeon]|nr:winged helix-turn-helix transcriptional regulator [Candidatus Woesearchaeota archaeon]
MVSRRRNELIADMFHEVHFVEKFGRSISLILSKEPDAEFELVGGIFITRFRRKAEGVEWLVERVVEGLVENQQKMLRMIAKNPHISKREMAEKIGTSTTAIDKNIETLKKNGLLKMVGGANGGYLEITNTT